MHFEILTEDISGKIALESIVEKILGPSGQDHTYDFRPYKGCGRLPKNLKPKTDASKRVLLDRLPILLRGYGKSFPGYPFAVIVVVDLDNRDCMSFKQELLDVLNACNPRPTTLFRIAIEESEAWLLGDRDALVAAYPRAKKQVLDSYEQDSICGTWQKLADAVYLGGSQALERLRGYQAGPEKCEWARKIGPLMDVDNNESQSFRVFRDGIRSLAGIEVR